MGEGEKKNEGGTGAGKIGGNRLIRKGRKDGGKRKNPFINTAKSKIHIR